MKKPYSSLFPLLLALSILTSVAAGAQTTTESLRKSYDFEKAVSLCKETMAATDSSDTGALDKLEQELILSENGLSMMAYCSHPVVIAKYHFSLDDFFLFYPMSNKAWRPLPSQPDSLDANRFVRAVYAPQDDDVIYYSSADEVGVHNLYRTVRKDSLWSVPRLINESLTSASDDIYPMLSPGGKELYFASKGLYGMGGYDLYMSTWDEKAGDWGSPVNMGFPYSSPFDDFLYVNTDDGKYSIFASNRECSADSVCIYVLEFDSMPIRKAAGSVEELRNITALEPLDDASNMNTGTGASGLGAEDESTREYMMKMTRVRELRDSISVLQTDLAQLRTRLASDKNADTQQIQDEISTKEATLAPMQASMEQVSKELQAIEMNFLLHGIVIDPDKFKSEADREVVGASTNYVFTKNEMGEPLDLHFETPEPAFDFTFKISDQGQILDESKMPDGLVYRIQILAAAQKAGTDKIKGLSPVFEREADGRFTYSVGVFRTYDDVLRKLNQVKKLGFKTAFITACKDRQAITVAAARKTEQNVHTIWRLCITPANGQSLPQDAINIIRNHTTRDIIRTLQAGKAVYEIGPFDTRQESQQLENALREIGITNISIVEAGKSW